MAKVARITVFVTLPDPTNEFVTEYYPGDAEEELSENDYDDHDILHDAIMAAIEDDPSAFFQYVTYERTEKIDVADE
jgi:hypothetical protein